MDELDQNARNLIRLARVEERPPSRAIRSRVQRGVAIAAPAAALLSGSVSTAAAKGAIATMGTLGLKASFIFGVACGVGVTTVGYGVANYRHATSAHPEPAQVATASREVRRLDTKHQRAVAVPAAQAPPMIAEELPVASDAPATITSKSSPKAHGIAVTKPVSGTDETPAAQRTPTLAAEISLLTEVQSHLRNGRASSALEILHRDDGRFAQSPLRPDLDAVRIFALCDLGRVEEARRASDDFLRRNPGSPLEQRVQNACARAVPSARRDSQAPTQGSSRSEL